MAKKSLKEIFCKGHYLDWIKEITGCSEVEAHEVEEIMRSEVFHSTLDWQDRRQWDKGCKEAYKIFVRNGRRLEYTGGEG